MATKEVLGKGGAHCEELRDNLKAAAARNTEQEQSTEVLEQELANLKVKAAKNGEGENEKIEKYGEIEKKLRPELE